MYVSAIVLAAGLGMRMKSNTAKPLLEINRKPIIVYSLEILSRHPQIKDIILVVNAKSLKNILSLLKRYRIKKIKAVVLGGKLRNDSVLKGLAQVDSCADLVLIHDA